jgi:hypothetical protein
MIMINFAEALTIGSLDIFAVKKNWKSISMDVKDGMKGVSQGWIAVHSQLE